MDDYAAQLLLSVALASVSLVRTVLVAYMQAMAVLAVLVLVIAAGANARE